jgi:cytochrome b561
MPPVTRYTNTAITLHWLIFALIACGLTLAVYMVDLPLSPPKLKYYAWHKWLGVTVFLLALARVTWRLTHGAPALPESMPAWQRNAARATHVLLYALIVVIPLTGWLYSSAAGVSTVYLGVVPLPDLLAKNKLLAEQLKWVHVTLNYTMLAVVITHVAAALQHHFVARDDILSRMLPAVRPRAGHTNDA